MDQIVNMDVPIERMARLKGLGDAEVRVHLAIADAIIDRRIPPGTQLVEAQLSEVFGLSRMRIRKVLHSLGHTPFVTLLPRRGAFVAQPKIEEARQIFEARRLMEEGIVRLLAARATAVQLAGLTDHIGREENARRDGDEIGAVQLAGDFHVVLAESTGNPILIDQMRDLIDRTRFIISVFGTEGSHGCPAHARIVDALEHGDSEAVAALMRDHLFEIENSLDLTVAGDGPIDFRRVFGPGKIQ